MDFETAIESYRHHCNKHGVTFEQPSALHSTLEDGHWVLANVNGVLFTTRIDEPCENNSIPRSREQIVTEAREIYTNWIKVGFKYEIDFEQGEDGVACRVPIGDVVPSLSEWLNEYNGHFASAFGWITYADIVQSLADHPALGEQIVEELRNSTCDSQGRARRRLLHHVVSHLNDQVIETAVDGLRDLLTDVPEITEELLAPIFERSEYWPNEIAKESLGLPADQDFETEELLEKFDNRSEVRDPTDTTNDEGF